MWPWPGIENLFIGDTVADLNDPRPLPPLKIDEPTLEMVFSVNTSPFAGREGQLCDVAADSRPAA